MSDIRAFLHGQVLAMDRASFDSLKHVLATFNEEKLKELAARQAEPQAAAGGSSMAGAVAVLPVYGMLTPRRNVVSQMFGGTPLTSLASAFRNVMADPGIKAVVLEVDSPGGSVYGITELVREIRAARGQKPIVAVANCVAASAAYWLGSAADEFVATPSAEVGSIGAYIVHVNEGKAAEANGLEVTVFVAGDLKAAETGVTTLTPEECASWQARVDSALAQFHGDVAKNRGEAVEAVRKGYGRGGLLGAAAAKAERMVDRVSTLEETVQRLSSPAGRRSTMGAGAAIAARVFALGLPADEVPEQLPAEPEDTPAPEGGVTASAELDPKTRRLKAKLKATRDE